jgi:transposase, IS5 family
MIRNWTTTHAAAHEGTRLEDVLDRQNTASDIWADTAYRSAKNEAMLARRGFVSRTHRKKPPGRPMPERMRMANAQKSKVGSVVASTCSRIRKDRWASSCARLA